MFLKSVYIRMTIYDFQKNLSGLVSVGKNSWITIPIFAPLNGAICLSYPDYLLDISKNCSVKDETNKITIKIYSIIYENCDNFK